MPFTKHARDTYFSQELSQFTTAVLPDVSNDFPRRKSWVTEYRMNSVLRFDVPANVRPFYFAFLRRAESTFLEYDLFRSALSDYFADPRLLLSLYMRSLHHVEIATSMAYQAFVFLGKATPAGRFVKNDRSPLQRLNAIYNVSRHFDPLQLPEGHLHAIWLKNDGIHAAEMTNGAKVESLVTFDELGELLTKLGTWANTLADVSSVPAPSDQPQS